MCTPMALDQPPARPESRVRRTYITQPGKLIRLGAVAQAMLREAQDTPCDAAGCERLRAIYQRTNDELHGLLSDDLRAELAHLVLPFENMAPTPSELRVAQAELVGWLEGLFSGIASAITAQELEARAQSEALAGTTIDSMPGHYL